MDKLELIVRRIPMGQCPFCKHKQFIVSEIVKIFNDYNFWEYDIPTVDKEKQRESETLTAGDYVEEKKSYQRF